MLEIRLTVLTALQSGKVGVVVRRAHLYALLEERISVALLTARQTGIVLSEVSKGTRINAQEGSWISIGIVGTSGIAKSLKAKFASATAVGNANLTV